MKKSAIWRAKIKKIVEDREAEELLVEAPWHKQCAKCKFFFSNSLHCIQLF